MEAQAREYFVQRINEIARAKVQAKAVELFGPTGRPQQPTWGMVFEAIKAGEITLKEDKVDYTGPYLNPQDVVWPAMEAKKQALCDYQGVVDKEKQKAIDGAYLALEDYEALKAFEAV